MPEQFPPAWRDVVHDEQKPAAGAQYAGRLLERNDRTMHMVQGPDGQHRWEALRPEWQVLADALNELQWTSEAGERARGPLPVGFKPGQRGVERHIRGAGR